MFGIPPLYVAEAAGLYPGAPEATVELIATGLWFVHVLQVYTSCMVTLAVWDWLVCLPVEWERVWKREWSLVKFLYIWNRYYGLVCFSVNLWLFNGQISIEDCKSLHFVIVATCMWSTLGSEAILALRTYAFLGRKRSIATLLIIMLLIETGYLLYVAIGGVHQTPMLYGTIGPCTASDAPGRHVVTGFWLCPVVFDLICTGLTAIKAFRLHNLGMKSGIVKTFVTEGLFYFLAITVINVINAAFMFQSNANIQNINCYLALVIAQVLCCRLVLNLRAPDYAVTTSVNSGSHPIAHPPQFRRNNSMGTGRFSIPLNTFDQSTGEVYNEEYNGVKIHVEVDREG
ncbi:hypothetical protein BDP27DRAFT_1366802 [Rhodocollybia butyracea]|uniref:DUF6533 domain-containing protein n=1 Tax=Rhodocollybia butyracea TaxID=206335 RepID=A0A9P5PKE0_9AGAR|nr:hypothetical protein BDP27DRAFT_1366802 [Rhodocollybia butyracea]